MQDNFRVALTQVTKRFGARLVLDGIGLTLEPGETVAVIGPSGGGKSTLLRCINGLTRFDAGEIRVGPNCMTPATPSRTIQELRRLFGMVFQDFQLFPHLTALGNIVEAPVRVLGLRKAEAVDRGIALLKRVGLADRGGAYPAELSGGQKQRVAIARALAMEPRWLLCDEITAALDPELKYEVLGVLEDLKKDGMTLLVVTHEMGFARRAADRVVVLADGQIVEQGPPAQVFDQPRTERTKVFLSRVFA